MSTVIPSIVKEWLGNHPFGAYQPMYTPGFRSQVGHQGNAQPVFFLVRHLNRLLIQLKIITSITDPCVSLSIWVLAKRRPRNTLRNIMMGFSMESGRVRVASFRDIHCSVDLSPFSSTAQVCGQTWGIGRRRGARTGDGSRVEAMWR